MCIRTGRPTSGKVPIRFGTYNIRNGRNGGLEAALRGVSQANMYLGILKETKLTDGIYTCGSAGYSVVATDVPSRHRGGVTIFYRKVWCQAVEDCDSAAVSARHVCRNNAIVGRPAGVDFISKFFFLEDAQVHFGR